MGRKGKRILTWIAIGLGGLWLANKIGVLDAFAKPVKEGLKDAPLVGPIFKVILTSTDETPTRSSSGDDEVPLAKATAEQLASFPGDVEAAKSSDKADAWFYNTKTNRWSLAVG